jgi:hypothetical protein
MAGGERKIAWLGQAEAVLLKYLNDNPADLHQRAELLLISAFRAVWHCK